MAPTAPTSRQVVVFELQGETYAVGIQHVQEIIRYTLPRSVSGTDPAIRGVINLRGKIIPIIDMKMRLAIDGVIDPESAKIVVVETSVGVAGIIVDEVAEVRTLDASSLDVVPDFAAHAAFVDGVAKVGDRLILLLEPDSLFAIELGNSYAVAA